MTIRLLVPLLAMLLAVPVGGGETEPMLEVTGTVLDPAGRAVAGATVGGAWLPPDLPRMAGIPAAQELFGNAFLSVADEVALATTDDDGTFTLEIPADRSAYLVAVAEGYAPFRVFPAVFEGHVTIRLDRGVTSRVRVLTAEGRKPVAGARVSAKQGEPGVPTRLARGAELIHRVEATTGEDGWAKLRGLGRTGYQVRVEAADRVTVDRVSVAGGASLRVEMPRAAALGGFVRDEAGEPVEGATVKAAAVLSSDEDPNRQGVVWSVWSENRGSRVVEVETTTDAAGAYRLDGLPPSSGARVAVSADGFSGAVDRADLPAGGEEGRLDLVLPPTHPMRVRFVDDRDRGIEGVEARLVACPEEGRPEYPGWEEFNALSPDEKAEYHLFSAIEDPVGVRSEAESDENGRVELEARGDRCQDLGWSAEGFLDGSKQIAIEEDGLPSELDDIELASAFAIAGTVVDFDDQPVPAVTLYLLDPADGGEASDGDDTAQAPGRAPYRWSERDAKTDETGAFSVSDLPEGGRYRIVVRAGNEGWRQEVEPLAEPGRRDLRIRLDGAAVLTGRAMDALSLEPLPTAWVVARERTSGGLMGSLFGGSRSEPKEFRQRVDDDGRFRLAVAPGRYLVQVRNKGFLPVSLPAEAEADRETGLEDVGLERGATVRGIVLGPDELPLAGAQVGEADDAPFSLAAVQEMTRAPEGVPSSLARTVSRLDGGFELTGLPRGDVRLRVYHVACAPLDETLPALSAGEAREGIVLRTHLGGSIEGVFTHEGKPVTGTFVAAASLQDIAGARTATTDDEGRFRMDRLPAGQHFVVGMPPDMRGSMPIPLQVEVRPGEVTRVALATGGGIAVEGRVTLRGAPLAGASVSFIAAGTLIADSAAATLPTAGDGSFKATVASAGDYLALVKSEEPALSFVRRVSIAAGGGALPELAAPTTAKLAVTVEDSAGGEVAGARVTLWPEEALATLPPWTRNEVAVKRVTDSEGQMTLGGLVPGTYRLAAEAEGEGSAIDSVTLREGRERGSVTLTLAGSRSVLGSVTTDEGRPVRQAMLMIVEETGEAPFNLQGNTDDAGLFELEALPDRPVVLAVGAQQRGLALVPHAPGDDDPLVALQPAGGVDLLVTDAGGERIEVALALENADGVVLAPGTLAGIQLVLGGRTAPDREGWIRLRGLEPGEYTFRAMRGADEVGSTSVTIRAHVVVEERLRAR